MDNVFSLRDSLSASQDAKDKSRTAGAGVWGNYVIATMSNSGQPLQLSAEEFDSRHNNLMEELENIKPLSKEEKNSIRSAKSVVRKVVEQGKPLSVFEWETATIPKRADDGSLVVVGKSQLQDQKTDFQRLTSYVDAISKKLESDNLDITSEEMAEIARMIQGIAAKAWAVGANIAGENAADFIADNS